MGFSELFGQDRLVAYVGKVLKEDRIGHAYIIEGPAGIGKEKFAMGFAKAILCKNKAALGCDLCNSCKKVDHSNHPDLNIIEPDGQSIKNEQIEAIQEKLLRVPYEAEKMICIIKNAEKMTERAQNRFLKTLEEPSEKVVIILLVENAGKMLVTIKSRCQILKMDLVSQAKIATYLKSKYGLDDDYAKVLAVFSQGIIGQAELLCESKELKDKRDELIEMIGKIIDGKSVDIFFCLDFFEKFKESIEEVIDMMVYWYRDLLMIGVNKEFACIINLDKKEQLMAHFKKIDYMKISKIIEILEKTKLDLRRNLSFQMVLETMLLKIQEV